MTKFQELQKRRKEIQEQINEAEEILESGGDWLNFTDKEYTASICVPGGLPIRVLTIKEFV